ncbi:hypothetical protein [Veronia pacifica]|uniref:Uncharacterized protein n=1 Tax=Veronia pacifica TaxID=1080227 RepID=A0A1C3E785_9GAMM|nr:hypothetical protein [Veronia pacifica]ODA29019.1 hypothetical protein A8L45_22890 [Veronia pacifica]
MTGISVGDITTDGIVCVGRENFITQNIYKSADYKILLLGREKAKKNVEKYPDDADFKKELLDSENELVCFEKDVVDIYNEINKININSERAKIAKDFFEKGLFNEARESLNTDDILKEQSKLLNAKLLNYEKLKLIDEQLEDNATELDLKAKLTLLDYERGEERITAATTLYNEALKSSKTIQRIISLAYFYMSMSSYKKAKALYLEAEGYLCEVKEYNKKINYEFILTFNMAIINEMEKDFDAAKVNYLESLEFLKNFL